MSGLANLTGLISGRANLHRGNDHGATVRSG